MTASPPPQDAADAANLLAREAAVLQREEIVGRRESMLAATNHLQQSHSTQIEVQLADGRDVNAQLVINAMRMHQLAEVADEAVHRRDEFLAMLSHELRNPLAPMHNAIDILGHLLGAEPRLPWIHGVLDRQVRQLTRLLDDLLAAAHVRAGKLVLKTEPLIVQTFMEPALEAGRPLIEARRQSLAVEWPPEPLLLEGDPVRLTQVFTNLLNNASKYTPPGGDITVRIQRREHQVIASVCDTGCGLSAEALPRIFEMFAQEHESLASSQGGLGVGLAVVRELVRLHGGSVEAFSAGPGLGSEFRVTLPLAPQGHAVLHVPTKRSTDRSAAHAPGSLSIVLIEDNTDANDSLSALLSLAGHRVASAYDGPQGVALVLEKQPQVVLCDLGLPGFDGLQVAVLLRRAGQKPPPLLVALTGYGQTADLQHSQEAGFDAHLVKPVEVRALFSLLDREIERLLRPPGATH